MSITEWMRGKRIHHTPGPWLISRRCPIFARESEKYSARRIRNLGNKVGPGRHAESEFRFAETVTEFGPGRLCSAFFLFRSFLASTRGLPLWSGSCSLASCDPCSLLLLVRIFIISVRDSSHYRFGSRKDLAIDKGADRWAILLIWRMATKDRARCIKPASWGIRC